MANNEKSTLTLTLNIEQTNLILGSLSAQPYERVAGLITTIQQQASSQLVEQPAVKAE